MSASLDLYRQMVPAHARVPDATVEVWLDAAATRHTASAWGNVYTAAMVAWAASRVEPLRVAGQAGELGATGDPCGPAMTPKGTPLTPPDPEATAYWSWYLDYRDSRAVSAPTNVTIGTAVVTTGG